MKAKHAIPKTVIDQFKRWGRQGGLARKKSLTKLQASAIGRTAGIASGKSRRGENSQ